MNYYTATNRDKKKKAKTGLAWCECCDCWLVATGQQCPNCGHISKGKRSRPFKKQYALQRDEDIY